MNYGETLVYWYLRLNGFFIVRDFVLHRVSVNETSRRHYSADADLLAVRFPHVMEKIGNQCVVTDAWFSTELVKRCIDIENNVVGLIVEVKTGKVDDAAIARSFGKVRLKYAVRRFGFWPDSDLTSRVTALTKAGFSEYGNKQVATLLVTAQTAGLSNNAQPPHLTLPLDCTEAFINKRFREFSQPKQAGRMFFPDELIQYLAWRAPERQP